MEGGVVDADGLFRRADIEIELAHLVLRLARRVEAEGRQPDGQAKVLAWFEGASVELMERVAVTDRPFAGRRLAQIGETIAGISGSSGAFP